MPFMKSRMSAFSLLKLANSKSKQRFHYRGQQLCKLTGTKESFCIIKKVQLLHCFGTPIVVFTLEPPSIMYVSVAPTLSVKGYNVSTSALLGDNGSVRSSKKPKFVAKYGLHHNWEHTWPIRIGSHVHDVHVPRFQDSDERRDWQLLLQVIDFVNKCEAIFSTERLKISKRTWIKRPVCLRCVSQMTISSYRRKIWTLYLYL